MDQSAFASALVSLVEWGESLDPSDPVGQQQRRFKNWCDAQATAPVPTPAAARLCEAGDWLPAWKALPVLDLMATLETLIDGQWSAQQTSCRPVRSVSDTAYYLLRKHRGRPTRADRRPYTAPHVLRRFDVVRRQQGQQELLLGMLDQRADAVLNRHQASPTGYVVHFDAGLELDLLSHAAGIQVAAIKEAEAHQGHVLGALRLAAGSTFLVFPECTMPAALCEVLSQAIGASSNPPALTLAGSFHEPQAHLPGGPCLNRAQLLDHRGRSVLTHVKTASATLISRRGKVLPEYITLHSRMHGLVTSLGVIGVAICIEFSDPCAEPLRAWTAVAPRWMLVPSMGEDSTVALHVRTAESLRDTHRTTTLIANQSPTPKALVPGCIVGLKDEKHAYPGSNQVTPLPRTDA